MPQGFCAAGRRRANVRSPAYGRALRRTRGAKDRGPLGCARAGARGVAELGRWVTSLLAPRLADRRPRTQRRRFYPEGSCYRGEPGRYRWFIIRRRRAIVRITVSAKSGSLATIDRNLSVSTSHNCA